MLVLVWAFLLKKAANPLWVLLTAVLGIIGAVVFLVTSDFNLPMGIADIWTIVNGVILLAGIICLILGFSGKKVGSH